MDEFEYKQSYFNQKHRPLFDDLIYDEKMYKKGIIYETPFFIAYAPYASEFPFEVMITSKVKKPSLIYFDNIFVKHLSKIVEIVIKKLNTTLGEFSYNIIINNAPFVKIEEEELANIYRFHIKIVPRLYTIAGFELNSGIFINPVYLKK